MSSLRLLRRGMTAICVSALSIAGTSRASEPQVSIAFPESSQPLAEAESILRIPFVPRPDMAGATLYFPGQGISPNLPPAKGSPPGVSGAVGPNHYVQTVNFGIEIWNKSGIPVVASKSLNVLWTGYTGTNVGNGCSARNDGSAVVLYDQLADRWFITQNSVPNPTSSAGPNFQCVAVSKTGDPAGAYWLYDYSYPGVNFGGSFSVWPDAYYATFDLFAGGTNAFLGATLCAYDRNNMLNGSPALQVCLLLPSSHGVQPVSVEGPIPPPRDAPGLVLELGTNQLTLSGFHVDWTTPGLSTLSGMFIPVNAFTIACSGPSPFACIPQPSPGNALRAISDRLMSPVSYRNYGTHEAIIANHTITSNTTSGIRWYEIRNPRFVPVLFQQGTYALNDTSWRWLGSIAEDSAEGFATGFSMSSATLRPSIAWTGRINTDPLDSMGQGEFTLETGGGVESGTGANRWGPFSSMTIDPTDDCTFWYTNELHSTNGAFTWDTRIATTKFANCRANDFSISVTPATHSLSPGSAIHFTIATTATAGAPEMIDLNVQDLPSATTGSFFPNPITAGSTSRLNVNVPVGYSPTGTFTFTVIGKAASAVHAATAQFSLVSTPPPATPTNLVATAVTSNQVAVTWSSVAADSYDVYRRAPGVAFTFVANRTSPSYTDNSVTPDTSYIYSVKAVGPGGESSFSNMDLATTTIFADDPLVANTTLIKTVHRDQIRTAVIAVEALAGTTFVFGSSDPHILSDDVTIVRLVLNMARSNLGLPALTYMHTANMGTPITAIDFQELRNGVK